MSEPLTLADLRSTGHSLTDTLNTLIANIHLPFVLESPLDLTPSLLLAILECILQERLPISITIRESRNEWDKVEAMKIFLGVLESDIIKKDVGLSYVDPRKLAAGEWDELVFVGEILCWLGKAAGILLLDNDSPVEEELEDVFGKARDNTVSLGLSQSRTNVASPSTHSSLTDSANTGLSMVSDTNNGSDTTVMSQTFDVQRSISPLFTPHPPDRTDTFSIEGHRPHCIHELEDESFILRALRESSLDDSIELEDSSSDLSYSDCPSRVSGSSAVPIQHTGWLQKVDDDSEIQSFEVNRRRRALYKNRNRSQDYSFLEHSEGRNFSVPSISSHALSRSEGYELPQGVVTKHNSPTQHTLALMNERAKLLTELASLARISPRTR